MKRTALVLQILALLVSIALLLAPTEGAIGQIASWFIPHSTLKNSQALLLSVVFNVSVLVMLLLPPRWSGSNELLFSSGFGICLALVLGYFSFRLCILQFAAASTIGAMAKRSA
jgi:hypothetical protein